MQNKRAICCKSKRFCLIKVEINKDKYKVILIFFFWNFRKTEWLTLFGSNSFWIITIYNLINSWKYVTVSVFNCNFYVENSEDVISLKSFGNPFTYGLIFEILRIEKIKTREKRVK